MQFPFNLHIAGREISSHFVLEVLSIFVGVRYYVYLRKRKIDKISELNRLRIFIAVCGGALLGSRLVGVLENPMEFAASTNKFYYIFTNKTIVGGLLFALFFVELLKLRLGIKVSSGDLMTYPLILALIIGRVGCFCEGMQDGTAGGSTSFFTSVDFGDGVGRHPLQLYEIFFLLILWFVIARLEKWQDLADGAKFRLFLISYFFYRFWVEFLKDNYFTVLGLSTIQITCLIGLVYYLKTIVRPKTLFSQHA